MDKTPNISPKKRNRKAIIDEEDSNAKIIESLTSKYTELESTDLLGKTIEHLRENIKPGICLICIENVERDEAVWSCGKCYTILHLVCIQRWAKGSMENVREAIGKKACDIYLWPVSYKGFNLPIVWCCPKCRDEYQEAEFPNQYRCFCSKVLNPKSDAWSAPHSCGETCGKKLKPECGHVCILLCHSGGCPPCPKQITSSCHCGQSEPKTLRCYAKSWSCDEICSKLLPCELHHCPKKCHEDECPPCTVPVNIPCRCSNPRNMEIPCSDINSMDVVISCGSECKKLLDCGLHKCTLVCHETNCPRCEIQCPCGKKKVLCLGHQSRGVGKPCDDTCDKDLDCQQHRCEQKCHAGNCGSCLQSVVKRCKCGTYEKEMICSKEFICTTKCRKFRDCGIHTCNKRCCPGDCPPCRNPCGKTLQCKNHKCEMICHRGPCYPCPVTAQVKCYCGYTVRFVPCGSEKKCKPPDCTQFCAKNSKCDHPEIQAHRCHFSECPPCRLNCGKLFACGHTCPSNCHSFKLNRKPCFKCVQKVPSKCPIHPSVEVQCCKLDEMCEETCGQPLFCGEHCCSKKCHYSIQEDCGQCYQSCSKPRPPGCDHECELGCHAGPCQDCTLVAKLLCHCEAETLFITCFKQHTLTETDRSCKNQCPKKLKCGHRCLSLCHSGECPPLEKCRRKVKVTCRCKIFKKEMECFLLGDSKILDCSTTTCNTSTKSPNAATNNKTKRKPRHKKNSESHQENNTGSMDNKDPNQSDQNLQVDNKAHGGGLAKPVIMYAVVAVAVLITGLVFGFSNVKT